MTLRDERRSVITVANRSYVYWNIADIPGMRRLPYALRVLLEHTVRGMARGVVGEDQLEVLLRWDPQAQPDTEVQFTPSRVVMQDFTGVPCVVDLATMRDAVRDLGGNPSVINPQVPVDLVIDHSVQIDAYAQTDACERNMELEYQRNHERYQFLRWGQRAFDGLRVVPPGTGIIHQVNLEHVAQVVMVDETGDMPTAYLDSCVGTDSHTTMINGLGVLGWGVGGIEAEAAMLGQPVSMLLPKVVGFRLTGSMREGVTATDVVLTITEMLRQHGVVGKFVEFYGDGIANMPLANRATMSNMAPEFGSTCAIFPIDEVTIAYLRDTGRDATQVALVEAYAKANGLWHDVHDPAYEEPRYSEYLSLDLSTVVPSIAGPKRPQDRIALSDARQALHETLPTYIAQRGDQHERSVPVHSVRLGDFDLRDGAVVIASITSCTNTSNPSVMMAAGLLARNAVRRGLRPQPWVKTSLAPGSPVVADYLRSSGLQDDLDVLGFNVVGFGCATCIGNSGPLPEDISAAIHEHDLAVSAVLSGNRNFEGRISPDVAMNYLASPPLVIAYALAGTMDIDFATQPVGYDEHGEPVMLRELWPSNDDVAAWVSRTIDRSMFERDYASVFDGDERWRALPVPDGELFAWDETSTYVRRPPFFEGMGATVDAVRDIQGARVLALLGDSVTTDHISPAGAFAADSPAGEYLREAGVEVKDFNSYGSRRGNHEVMMRGTFGNIRLRNQLLGSLGLPERSGGYTYDFLADRPTTIWQASVHYRQQGVPLVVLAGKEYGTGSSRDWAAKGTMLLGVRAVIAQSFERIHRSNLIGMGVLPLQFAEGVSAQSLGLDGTETYDIEGLSAWQAPEAPRTVTVRARRADGGECRFEAVVRIDTPGEAQYYRHGGILPYVLRQLMAGEASH